MEEIKYTFDTRVCITNLSNNEPSEESKYYTPNIEEFHVGFEYESLYNDNWEKNTITKQVVSSFDDLIDDFNYYSVRVKYLDSSDIEDLGFIDAEEITPLFPGYKCYFNNKLGLRLYFGSNQKVILRRPLSDGIILFRGTVKNKSELKKVLTQIGVL
jgi:hypothetical protein